MFNNPFLKKDSLLEAVKEAQAEGELRRMAEAHVNEQFGVYSRKAVVREDLAAYDAALEEAYANLKEGLDPVGKEDDDVNNNGRKNDKSDKYIMNKRAAIGRAMGKRMEEGNVSLKDVRDADAAQNPSGYAAMRNKSEDQALERAGKGLARDIKEKKMWEGSNLDPKDSDVTAASKTISKGSYEDPSTPKVPYSQLPKPGNRAGAVIDSAKGAAGMNEEHIDELYGKGSLGKIKGHHEKEAKKAYRKFDKVSGLSKLDALEKKGEHHQAQSDRASDLMSRKPSKPSRGGDNLSYRTPSKGLVTRGPRKGKMYAGEPEQLKINIKHALGKHKKPNLPEDYQLDEATRKHFRAHAEDISKISDQEERNKAASAAASTYARLNPRFDHAKFHKAAGSTAHQPEKVNEEKWIQAALSKKTKGALHKDLNVSQKKKIPLSKLKAASDDPGKTGKRARLAMTLRKLREKLESDSFKAAQGTGKSVNEVAMGVPPAITPPAITRPAKSTSGMRAPTGSFRGVGSQPLKPSSTQVSSGGVKPSAGYDIASRMSAAGRDAATSRASNLGGMNAVDRIGGAIKSATTSSAGSSAKAMVDGGRAAISRGVGALGAGARVARGAVGGPTGAALTAASIAAPYVAAKMSASHKAGHSSFTGTHQQTPDVKASDSFARMRQMSQTSTASSTPAASKPAIDPTAKGAKYAGGNVHNVTTLKQTAPGDQAQIQSVKTEKGWADPGRWENEVKSKTGAMQQIRTTPDRHIVDTPTQQVGRPSASSEKSTSNFLQSQGIGSSASTQSSETPAKASVNFNKKSVQENDEKAKSPKPMMTTFSPAAPMGNLPKMSDHPPSSLKEEVTVGNNKYRIV